MLDLHTPRYAWHIVLVTKVKEGFLLFTYLQFVFYKLGGLISGYLSDPAFLSVFIFCIILEDNLFRIYELGMWGRSHLDVGIELTFALNISL